MNDRNAIVVRHLAIHGLVQGVSYRWSMVQAARRFGVRGWVRNRRDGSVEALAAGEAGAVEALVRWAHQGPDGARVDAVDLGDMVGTTPADDLPEGFEQRETV
ncbi:MULTISPECIES: acylphosphatase [unclassified Variovorax]|jgi:acylphosphatase|uniref:acylphosphatase n=1 Tax=unclassified Variovorax TaxID=663243 RepID=UPI000F7E09E7|nr:MULTISPECIES: acylphosphatase [unclassified Variovorax]RSZ41289.1 acylphosphatase [Variovorax sp. 553]RSZ41803.1 acylphosphatase [Variovorax sp. 679]